MHFNCIYCSCLYIYMCTDVTVSMHPHVLMNITQSIEMSLVDGYSMCLTCMASVVNSNVTHNTIMRWSGVGLQQSLWVNQLPSVTHRHCIVRKLCFTPWLSSHAGEYICHVDVKNDLNFELTVNKSFTVNGMYSNSGIVLHQWMNVYLECFILEDKYAMKEAEILYFL